jgi:Holliday junction resolvase-like predicted endonuclease
MGFFVIAENPSSKGYIDIVLKKDNLIVICELKYSLTDFLKDLTIEAINQIKDKEYYAPYLDHDVVLLGIAFGS